MVAPAIYICLLSAIKQPVVYIQGVKLTKNEGRGVGGYTHMDPHVAMFLCHTLGLTQSRVPKSINSLRLFFPFPAN